jgi:hypothetical protein
MTLLVAFGFLTAVKFLPVLASRVTSGKKRLTTLMGTMTSRGSSESDALVVPLPDESVCPYAANERIPTTVINSAASDVSPEQWCRSRMRLFISIFNGSRIMKDSLEKHQCLNLAAGVFRENI